MDIETEVESMVEVATVPPAERLIESDETVINRRSKNNRSRVTNHQDLLPGLDGRSSSARRFRDLIFALVADAGGLENCSEIKLGLIRRLAATTVQAELLEAQMVNGVPVDIPTLCQLASTTVRLSTRLGIERIAKNIGPSFGDLLRDDIRRRRRRAGRKEAA
jgi:hypothetical protein